MINRKIFITILYKNIYLYIHHIAKQMEDQTLLKNSSYASANFINIQICTSYLSFRGVLRLQYLYISLFQPNFAIIKDLYNHKSRVNIQSVFLQKYWDCRTKWWNSEDSQILTCSMIRCICNLMTRIICI